jgi:protein-S-isoprenylcysteine O-methyltransferase Ste14
MVSLFFRNLLFTVLQPGIVVGLLPYLILRHGAANSWAAASTTRHYIALGMFAVGLLVLLACIVGLAVRGRGTLSPADPTQRLVVRGLYRYSRNPMYVGVMLMLLGGCLFFLHNGLWLYTLAVFVLFNGFIRYFEEPRLMRDFGNDYAIYRRRVRRWL